MSLYTRVHTPNSPLLPLSPMVPAVTPSMYLSPYATSIRSRRSFTPSHLNVLPPPSVSPIQASILSNKRMARDPFMRKSPERRSNQNTSILSSTKKSMKEIRSSTRKIEARNNHAYVSLAAIRRTLFVDSPPIVEIDSPKTPIAFVQLKTPQSKYRVNATPKAFLTPSARYQYNEHISSPNFDGHDATPGFLEETFTVMSILKEIHMQKYASLFAKEEVDLYVFLMLTNDDMDELGIDEHDRPVLLAAINCYTEFFGNPDNIIL